MPERTAGGLFLPDAETRDELLAPPDKKQPSTLPEATEGRRFAIQASSAYFVTDITTWCAELDDPAVLLLSEPLSDPLPLVPVLEAMAAQARPIFLAAPAIDGDALLLLIVNKLRGVLCVAAANASQETLSQIAGVTGCDVVAAAPTTSHLGSARRIVVGDVELAIVSRPGHGA
ncbi:MAG: hypothetical protein WKG01_22935 [Kofleriaceae bacterium]